MVTWLEAGADPAGRYCGGSGRKLVVWGTGLLVLCLVFLSRPVLAGDHVWIIGGGPEPANSQVSIEKNVIWIQQILGCLPGDRLVRTYFNDAREPAPDIVQENTRTKQGPDLLPLARVFDQQEVQREFFRNNHVATIDGTTRKDELLAALRRDISTLRSGDRVLLIFNGHGLQAKDEEEGNTIRVWGDGTVSVRELEEVLAEVEPDVPVRFVFPQCYSGGFFRLVTPGAKDILRLADGVRCGFFAVSEKRQSEG